MSDERSESTNAEFVQLLDSRFPQARRPGKKPRSVYAPKPAVRRIEAGVLACLVIGLATFGIAMATHSAVASDGRDHRSLSDFQTRQQMFDGQNYKAQNTPANRVMRDILRDIAAMKAARDAALDDKTRGIYEAQLAQLRAAIGE